MSFDSFIPDILATVFGGVLLALIFFFLREKAYPIPDLDGSWTFTQKTVKTEFNPYSNMELTYLALIWRMGNRIQGTAEKIHENSTAQVASATGGNRSHALLSGYIQKNILSPDTVVIHISEDGLKRKSSTVCKLEIAGSNRMEGRFVSTVANQEGVSSWIKKST